MYIHMVLCSAVQYSKGREIFLLYFFFQVSGRYMYSTARKGDLPHLFSLPGVGSLFLQCSKGGRSSSFIFSSRCRVGTCTVQQGREIFLIYFLLQVSGRYMYSTARNGDLTHLFSVLRVVQVHVRTAQQGMEILLIYFLFQVSGRYMYSAAREGDLPHLFSLLHWKLNTPIPAQVSLFRVMIQ